MTCDKFSGVDGFVGMEGDKYAVTENIGLNMTMSNMSGSSPASYLQPPAVMASPADQPAARSPVIVRQPAQVWETMLT